MADIQEFRRILRTHAARYPQMQCQDYAKLAYQNALGPEHLLADPAAFGRYLRQEWADAPESCPAPNPEEIGNGLCRFHLTQTDGLDTAASLLTRLCILTAQRYNAAPERLAENLACLEGAGIPGMATWLADYRSRGCPAVHHSAAYRSAYRPHYRLLLTAYAGSYPALRRIAALAQRGQPAVVAIDGRCGSGKTGLAKLIGALWPCNIVHMDDFYLPMPQRAENWLELPGGNIDFVRLRAEVLDPLRQGGSAVYRPYNCAAGNYREASVLLPHPLTVVEGSYSQHPQLAGLYDLTIFLNCPPGTQARRLRRREGAHYAAYRDRWVPLEENYIRACAPDRRCDLLLDTGAWFE